MASPQPDGSGHPPLPELELDNRAFWTGGGRGELLISRCAACRRWLHPPVPVCRYCLSTDVISTPAVGTGTVFSFTVNHQPWMPGMAVPFVVAVVELDDEPGLRLVTRLTGVEPADVRVGLPVRVVFEQHEDVWLPLFTPREAA
ncbi:Zn-ribbon domain-containing OB-fold protein [Sporichthya brevicatena]